MEMRKEATQSTHPGKTGPAARTVPLRDQLPDTWFPILRSADLGRGQCRAVEFMGKPWAVFRNREGRLGLVGRYCSHMGGDLTQGKVKDAHLECALHNWRFDTQGKCASPQGGAAHACSRLPAARIEERAGIIFAFAGTEPGFALADVLPAPAFFSSTSVLEMPFHWMLAAVNTFDPPHYGIIHHRRLVGVPELVRKEPWFLGFRYSARIIRKRWFDYMFAAMGIRESHIEIDCWGVSLLVMRNLKTKYGLVLATAPGIGESSWIFQTAFRLVPDGKRRPGPAQRLGLEIGRLFGLAFLKEDIPYLRGMLPHPGALLPGQDDVAIAYWDYYRNLPKAVSP
jgi:nitrite reductase/ring-hydroxylating ferredoxin subunit